MAMIEFAFCLPVLLILYVGGCCVSDMIACNRKVTIATRSLVDLVSRTMSPTIIYNDANSATARSYMSASAVVLSPYALNNANEQISLLRVCDSMHAYVVWTQAQTQTADGSTVTPTTSDQTAGTLPVAAPQPAGAVVAIPASMVTSTMAPTSPDGSDVCSNLAPGSVTTTQVGTAGAWLYMGKINYNFTPAINFFPVPSSLFTRTIYMVPRLY